MSTTNSTIRIGDMVKITNGLGKGQIVRVGGLKDLPMGTGVVVTLAGDERATLNPANVEVVASPDDDHLSCIRGHLYACVDDTLDVNSAAMIQHHADALAADLEAERARVARLQAALRAMGSLVDHIGRRESAHYPSMLSEDAKSEMGLQHGDLPDEEATR